MLKRETKQGFTLIELLVVIAIIAILAAILFPVFAQAREAARTTSCLSNEKQISLGLMQYVQDYDEHFPIWEYGMQQNINPDRPFGGSYLGDVFTWNDAVYPYIKNIQVFRCPDIGQYGNDWTNPGKDTTDWTGCMNYATNCYLSGRTNNSITMTEAQIPFPATTIILSESGVQTSGGACEGQDGNEWGWMDDAKTNMVYEGADGGVSGGVATGASGPPLKRHKGGANYAFADGHAKWYNAHSMGLVQDGVIPTDAQVDAVDTANGQHASWLIGNVGQ